MAGVIRKYPGLELLAGVTRLAAFVGLGGGTGSAVAPGAPLASSKNCCQRSLLLSGIVPPNARPGVA